MRILNVLVGFTAPAGIAGPMTLGGTANIVHRNARELVKRGHQVTVWTTNRLDKKRKFSTCTVHRQADGIDIWHLDTHCMPFWPGTLGPTYTPELASRLSAELRNFDLVHIHELRSYMAARVSQAAHRAGVPYVVQSHGCVDILSFYNSRLLKRAYDRMVMGRILGDAAAVVAIHDREREKFVRVGARRERVSVVPYGIEPRVAAAPVPGSFRARHGIGTEEPLLLFVGRFEKRKGADILARAFSLLKHTEARLCMVGPDDGTLAETQRVLRQAGREDRVIFTGALTGADLWSAYADADLFVYAPRIEAFGMVILECCTFGKPMVLGDTCELSDWLDGTAAVIAPSEPEPFAAAVDRLLDAPETRAQLAAGARSLISTRFDLASVIDRLEAVYRGVIHERLSRAASTVNS